MRDPVEFPTTEEYNLMAEANEKGKVMVFVVQRVFNGVEKPLIGLVGVYNSESEAKYETANLKDSLGIPLSDFVALEWDEENVAYAFSGVDIFKITEVEVGVTRHGK